MNFKSNIVSAAIAAMVLSGCSDKPEFHIYTWCDYISPDVIAQFEKRENCKVVIDTFDSNEAMYAKLKAGGTGYDLITPSSYQIPLMAREGMIEKIDHSQCPNVKKNFDPSFVSQLIDPELTYNVPYVVTYTGFCYQKNKIPAGADVASWSILENAALKGRLTLLDDMREVIGAGLMYLGYGVNSEDPAEIDAAVAQILKWKANIRKFDCESYRTEVPDGSTWVGHGYSNDSQQVILGDEDDGSARRDDIGFALPKEGYSIAFDEFVIAANSPNRELAYKFVDYLYDGEIAKQNMEYVQGPSPVKPGIDALDEDLRKLIVPTLEQLKYGQVLRSFDDKPAVQELYNRAWDKIKAGVQ